MRWFNQDGIFAGYVIAAAAAVSAFTFGAVETLGFAPTQLAIFLTATYVFWREGSPRLSMPIWALLATMVLFPLLQLVPLPEAVQGLLSSERIRIHELLKSAGIPIIARVPISVYPFATAAALLRLACYLLVFLLAIHNYHKHHRQPALIGLLIGLGLFEACYGITQYLTGFPYIFFHKKVIPLQDATGTYINRNHYAGLLAMSLPFITAAMLNRGRLHAKDGKGLLKKLLVSDQSSRFFFDAVLFVVVLIGLFFSLSRAGITAGLVGVCVSTVLMLQKHRRSTLTILALMMMATGAYVFWIGHLPVMERFEGLLTAVSGPEYRLSIWRDTWEMIQDFPLLGAGLGTYSWASLHYQSVLLSNRYEHAHNDVLQTAAEVGIPLAIMIWGALWTLLIQVVRKVEHLQRSNDRVLAAGCAGAMAALLLHSLADFNLQIPANALIFSWITGTAAALIHSSHQTHAASARGLTIDAFTQE